MSKKPPNTSARPNSGQTVGPGRDTKLSKELGEKFVSVIRRGSYRETAAAACGIPPRTLRDWMREAHKGREPYASWMRAVEEAEAEVEESAVASVLSEADWKARAWYLARKFPQRWAEKSFSDVAVTQKGTAKTEINIIGPGGIVPDIAKKKRSDDS